MSVSDPVWDNLPGSVLLGANKQLTVFRNFELSHYLPQLFQTTHDVNGKWLPWVNLEGPVRMMTNTPAAVLSTAGFSAPVLAVMDLDHDTNRLRYRRTNPQDGSWLPWVEAGTQTLVGGISTLPSSGLASIFVHGLGGDLWTLPSLIDAPAGWLSLGGNIIPDPVAIAHKGGVEVFARDSHLAVRNISRAKNAPGWGQWRSLGGTATSNLAVGNLTNGQNEVLRIFSRGADGKLWWTYQLPSGSWANWFPVGGIPVTSAPADYIDATGVDHVFARGPDGTLGYTRKELGPSWSPWQSLGTPPGTDSINSAPLVVKDSNPDQAFVFVLGSDNNIWWLLYRPGYLWKNWEQIPPPKA